MVRQDNRCTSFGVGWRAANLLNHINTFLPYQSFTDSARCLDNRRLGKQRVECLQILKVLYKTKRGATGVAWQNHPAVKMWQGYERSLTRYGVEVCWAWADRGFKDTCMAKMIDLGFSKELLIDPPWLGSESFHAAHRSNLLRKDPQHYGRFGWTESSDLPYIWPVNIK